MSADDPGTSEVVQATGTAIRKESIIQQQTNGVITYVVNDGGKVSKGGRLPRFMQRSRMLRHSSRLKPLNLQISQLQKLSSPGSTYAADQDTLNKQISQKLVALLQKSAPENLIRLRKQGKIFLYVLNERQIVTNKVEKNFDERIASLTQQRDSLSAGRQALGTITAPSAGIFISEVDGYEKRLLIMTIFFPLRRHSIVRAFKPRSRLPLTQLERFAENSNGMLSAWYPRRTR